MSKQPDIFNFFERKKTKRSNVDESDIPAYSESDTNQEKLSYGSAAKLAKLDNGAEMQKPRATDVVETGETAPQETGTDVNLGETAPQENSKNGDARDETAPQEKGSDYEKIETAPQETGTDVNLGETAPQENSKNGDARDETAPQEKGSDYEKIETAPQETSTDAKQSTDSITKINLVKIDPDGETDTQVKMLKHSIDLPLIHENMNTSWYKVLATEFNKPYFRKLNNFVEAERKLYNVYPPAQEVWAWTRLSIEDVKVVILGQDPYHREGQAHGLCFSVTPGTPLPPSLKNIYQELKTDIPGFQQPTHGNLMGWCKQGVLLLNATLTVQESRPKSHAGKGWENLTNFVIREVSARCSGVIFLLWGAHAQSKVVFINKSKHHILKSAHPSPLSAHRGFIGCKHFSQCNALLEKQGKNSIDWNHLPEN